MSERILPPDNAPLEAEALFQKDVGENTLFLAYPKMHCFLIIYHSYC